MKKITLSSPRAEVDFSHIQGEKAVMDIVDLVGGVGHENIQFTLDWSDEEECPSFKEWLVNTFGEEIKNHEKFILLSC